MAWRLFAIGQAGLRSPGPERAAVPVTVGGPSSQRTATDDGRAHRDHCRRRGADADHGGHACLGGDGHRPVSTPPWATSFPASGAALRVGWRTIRRPLNRPDYAWNGTERINFLLFGIDSGPGRGKEALTDTILVVSVDPKTRESRHDLGPPRRRIMPLPDRSVYADGAVPEQDQRADDRGERQPRLWCPDCPPDQADACGLRTLERTIGLYLGLPIQYYATIDLDRLHPADRCGRPARLCLPGKLIDATYNEPRRRLAGQAAGAWSCPPGAAEYTGMSGAGLRPAPEGLSRDARWHPCPAGVTSNGPTGSSRCCWGAAQEFARGWTSSSTCRTCCRAGGGPPSSPTSRATRPATSPALPALITDTNIRRVVLDLPRFDPPLEPEVNYILVPRRDDVRAEMRRLFGRGNLEGWYLATRDEGPDA